MAYVHGHGSKLSANIYSEHCKKWTSFHNDRHMECHIYSKMLKFPWLINPNISNMNSLIYMARKASHLSYNGFNYRKYVNLQSNDNINDAYD